MSNNHSGYGKTLRSRWLISLPFLLACLVACVLSLTGCGRQPARPMSYRFEYDDRGRIAQWVDGEGRGVRYAYDDSGRVTAVRYPERTVRLGYDAEGNLISMADGKGRQEYTYDPFGRLTEAAFKYSPARRVAYEYDPWGRIAVMKVLANGRVEYQVRYEYDLLGNLLAVDDGSGRVEYSYYPEKGETTRRLPNGITTTFVFSPQGELIGVTHIDASGNVIADYRYEHDAAGNVTEVRERTREGVKTIGYEWDRRGYLAALRQPNGSTIRYQYDPMGNRVARIEGSTVFRYEYDGYGRLTKCGSDTYRYDRAGYLSDAVEAGRRSRLQWDAEGRLLVARLPGQTLHYEYDGAGNMVSRFQNREVTYYLPNPLAPPGFILAEFDRRGRPQGSYLYGDALLGRRDARGRMLYFLEDGFSSIRQIADQRGRIVGGRDYSPFAEVTSSRGEQAGNFRMAGERQDPLTHYSLIFGGVYDSKQGRWIGPNPLAANPVRPDSFNAYAHTCGGPGAFQSPRCNQTHFLRRLENWAYRTLVKDYMIKPYSRYAFGEAFAQTGRTSGGLFEQAYRWRGRAFGEGFAKGVNTLLSAATFWHDLWTAEQLRAAQGIPYGSPEFWIDWGKGGLSLVGGAASGPLGSLGGIFAGEAAEGTGTFYGTRMDRPYWWWSPMKWLPQQEYLRRIEEQGKRQAVLAGEAEKHRSRLRDQLEAELPPSFGDQDDQRRRWFRPPRGPGFHDDGGGGGGGGGLSNPFGPGGNLFSPFKSEAPGGIDLSVTALLAGGLGKITGAVYDPKTQRVVLVGEDDMSLPALRLDDLAVALNCVFSGQDPMFSLDPADPANPKGPWLKCVYIGPIEDTTFGEAMFQADWLLKAYSFGVDEDGHELASSVPGFMSIFDLSFAHRGRRRGETWMRFWITCNEATLGRNGNALRFDTVRMKVNTENMWRAKRGLIAAVGQQDPIAKRFADHFTAHYDEFAREQPAFARVKQLACAVALAKWLRDLDVPLDLSWAERHANASFNTPEQVGALSGRQSRTWQIPGGVAMQKVYLFGGVDLGVKPPYLRYVPNDARAGQIQEAVRNALTKSPRSPVVEVSYAGKTQRGLVLPFTAEGQAAWKSGMIEAADGSVYRYDERLRVTSARRRDGSSMRFGYAEDGTLSSMTISVPDGWNGEGRATGDGSTMTVTSPRGDRFDYRWNQAGRLKDVRVNGNSLVNCTYDAATRIATLRYPSHTEILQFNAKERLVSRSANPSDVGAGGSRGTISLAYNDDGQLAEVSMPGVGRVQVHYAGGRVASIAGERGGVRYSYDSSGRLARAESAEFSAEYAYQGDSLRSVRWRQGAASGEASFAGGRLVRQQDAFGGVTRYQYDADGGLIRVEDAASGRAEYRYGQAGRIRGITLPGGGRLEFHYSPARAKGRGRTSVPERLEMIDVHPAEGERFGQIVPEDRRRSLTQLARLSPSESHDGRFPACTLPLGRLRSKRRVPSEPLIAHRYHGPEDWDAVCEELVAMSVPRNCGTRGWQRRGQKA